MAKILFVLESFFPTHRAGTEVYVLNLCHYFRKKGWQVGVLISTTTNSNDYIHESIPVYTFPVPEKPLAKELNGLIPPRGIEYFFERIKELKPDLVHFHSFGRAINGFHLKAVKEIGIKTAFTPHLATFFCIKADLRLYNKENCNGKIIDSRCLNCFMRSKGKSFYISLIITSLIKPLNKLRIFKKYLPPSFFIVEHRRNEILIVKNYSDLTFAVAPWIQKVFYNNNINSILIPQGISEVFLAQNFKIIDRLQKILHFVYIGRMHPIKGFHILKEVWNNYSDKNIVLHIITTKSDGEDQYFETHKQWAAEKNNIIWNENFTQTEVAAYLKKIDILILPSYTEMAPLVIQEAAAFSIPTIGSDYIAIKDMIKHGINGLLFKNGNWEDLKRQMDVIIDHPEIIESLKQNIKPPVTMNEVGEIIEQEYLKVLKDKW